PTSGTGACTRAHTDRVASFCSATTAGVTWLSASVPPAWPTTSRPRRWPELRASGSARSSACTGPSSTTADRAPSDVTAWDALAADYDRTRGGEERGDQYAADLDDRLPPGPGPVLEVGVGTGVVALGLRQRGRRVVGIDLSAPMLARGRARLGPCLVRGDACRLPFAVRSFPAAVSVWVIHTIGSPQDLLAEVTRVLRPGGR